MPKLIPIPMKELVSIKQYITNESKSLLYLSCPIFVNNVRKTPLSKVKS